MQSTFPVTSAVGRYNLKHNSSPFNKAQQALLYTRPAIECTFVGNDVCVCLVEFVGCMVCKQQKCRKTTLRSSKGGGINSSSFFHQVPGPKSPTKAIGHGTCFIHICNLVVR